MKTTDTVLARTIKANSDCIAILGEYITRGFLDKNEDDPDVLGRAMSYLIINNENLKHEIKKER